MSPRSATTCPADCSTRISGTPANTTQRIVSHQCNHQGRAERSVFSTHALCRRKSSSDGYSSFACTNSSSRSSAPVQPPTPKPIPYRNQVRRRLDDGHRAPRRRVRTHSQELAAPPARVLGQHSGKRGGRGPVRKEARTAKAFGLRSRQQRHARTREESGTIRSARDDRTNGRADERANGTDLRFEC